MAFAHVYARFMAKPVENLRRADSVNALYTLDDSLSKTLITPSLGMGRCTSLMQGTKMGGQSADAVSCHVPNDSTVNSPVNAPLSSKTGYVSSVGRGKFTSRA